MGGSTVLSYKYPYSGNTVEGEGGGYSFTARLSHLAVDHACIRSEAKHRYYSS